MDDLMQSVFCPNSPIAQKSFNEALHCFQRFANLHYTVQWCIFKSSTLAFRECVRAGAAGSQTRRTLGHHLLHPLILRPLVLCAPAVLRPRALQDAPAPADSNS